MCDSKECICGENCEEEVMTKEDLVNSAIENISEGGCLGCTLLEMYEIGYREAEKDIAELYKRISEDILEEV